MPKEPPYKGRYVHFFRGVLVGELHLKGKGDATKSLWGKIFAENGEFRPESVMPLTMPQSARTVLNSAEWDELPRFQRQEAVWGTESMLVIGKDMEAGLIRLGFKNVPWPFLLELSTWSLTVRLRFVNVHMVDIIKQKKVPDAGEVTIEKGRVRVWENAGFEPHIYFDVTKENPENAGFPPRSEFIPYVEDSRRRSQLVPVGFAEQVFTATASEIIRF